MLAINEASAGYENGHLFEKLNLTLNRGDRVGIVGPNGAGKSSLLRMIQGELSPDKGSVITDASVGYLAQVPEFDEPVASYIDKMSGGLLSIEAELQELYPNMGDPAIDKRVGQLQAEFEERNGWDIQSRIDEVLSKLGAPEDAMSKDFGEFSGGQQSRILLAGQLIQEPDVLLLDEPTNNLDREGLEWLEGYLSEYKGAVAVVSHDREFLDSTATKIVEIDGTGGEPEYYDGNYSAYREEKAARQDRHDLLLEAQLKKQNQMEEAVANRKALSARIGNSANAYYRAKAAKVDRGRKSMGQQLDKKKKSDDWLTERKERKSLPLELAGESQPGRRLLAASALRLGYDAEKPPIIDDATFTIHGQDRVAITGNNGAGKTTLLSAMAGNESVVQGGQVETFADFNYLTQAETQKEVKGSNASMLDWFRQSVGAIYEEEAMSLLVSFGFDKHRLRQPVKNLSPGEVTKLSLLGMTYSGKELLLLDEPTNHLDFDALDVVEESLSEFKGTLVTVSHDRRFLGRIACNRMFEVKDSRVTATDM